MPRWKFLEVPYNAIKLSDYIRHPGPDPGSSSYDNAVVIYISDVVDSESSSE